MMSLISYCFSYMRQGYSSLGAFIQRSYPRWCTLLAINGLITATLVPVCAAWGLPISYGSILATPLIGPLVSWLLAWGFLLMLAAFCNIGITFCCWIFEQSVSALYLLIALPLPRGLMCCMPELPWYVSIGIILITATIAHYRFFWRRPLIFASVVILWLCCLQGLSMLLRRTEPLLYEQGSTKLYIRSSEKGVSIDDMSTRCSTRHPEQWFIYTLRPLLIKEFGCMHIIQWNLHKSTQKLRMRAECLHACGWIERIEPSKKL